MASTPFSRIATGHPAGPEMPGLMSQIHQGDFSYETQGTEASYDCGMLGNRPATRKAATWLLSFVAGSIILAVVAEWFIAVATDKGLFEDAGDQWDSFMGAIAEFATPGWVIYPLIGLAGLVAGLWLDVLLRKREAVLEPDLSMQPMMETMEAGTPDDPAVREPLTAFYLDAVKPAIQHCHRLQVICIVRITSEDKFPRELMRRGIEAANGPVSELYQSQKFLEQTLHEEQFVPAHDLIEHLSFIKAGYWGICAEAGKLLKHERVDPVNDDELAVSFREFAQHNNALIEQAEKLARDSRLGPLYRPGRTGEWGCMMPEAWNKNAV